MAVRARPDFLVPIHDTVAGINGVRVMGLPAVGLPHGPRACDVVVLVPVHPHITRDLRAIDPMHLGEPCLVRQRVVDRVHGWTSWSVATVVSTGVIRWGASSSQVTVRGTCYPRQAWPRFSLYRDSGSSGAAIIIDEGGKFLASRQWTT